MSALGLHGSVGMPQAAPSYERLKRGLNRLEAATYVGVGISKFDELVRDGRMPGPKRIDGRIVWDIRGLDMAFDALPEATEAPADTWAHLA